MDKLTYAYNVHRAGEYEHPLTDMIRLRPSSTITHYISLNLQENELTLNKH